VPAGLLSDLPAVIETFETARMSLRPLSLDDVDEMVVLDSDSEVMRYINGGRPTPRAEMVKTIEASLDHRWVALEKATGMLIGWFAIRPSDPDGQERELGYRLRRDAWGKGYASEGSLALIALAFDTFGARRIWAQTMTVNSASRRVMERCGLRYVRTFHLNWPEPIDGTELGDVEYELLMEEWKAVAAH